MTEVLGTKMEAAALLLTTDTDTTHTKGKRPAFTQTKNRIQKPKELLRQREGRQQRG